MGARELGHHLDGCADARHGRRRGYPANSPAEVESGRPATPIIALTANAMVHQIERYSAAGMSGFVAKPIEVASLFATIATALEDSKSFQGVTGEFSDTFARRVADSRPWRRGLVALTVSLWSSPDFRSWRIFAVSRLSAVSGKKRL